MDICLNIGFRKYFPENSERLSSFLSIALTICLSWFSYLNNHLALRSCQSPHYLLFQLEPLRRKGGCGGYICISWVDSSYPALSCALRPRCTDDSLSLIHSKGLLCQKSWMGGHQLFTCQSKQCKEILLSASEPDCSVQLFSCCSSVNAALRLAQIQLSGKLVVCKGITVF